jgi:hypothetical protein
MKLILKILEQEGRDARAFPERPELLGTRRADETPGLDAAMDWIDPD